MSSRRAIACTICAKAKTKCDKAVPSCSRCTAKGLPCEPRSTRRTSDSNYRNTKTRQIVSPKRFSSAVSVPSLSRHTSPRSVPSSERPQMMRAHSHMDMHTAQKMRQQTPTDFSAYPMLTPLPTYSPQIIDECYSYSSSPEQNMHTFYNAGRMTPQTPDSFLYHDSLASTDAFDQYMNTQTWSDDGNGMPIGLGFENDIPGLIPVESPWCTPEPEGFSMPMGQMRFDSPFCGSVSPAPMNEWSHDLSLSPPQMPHSMPHTRAVPSLSISDCSIQDFESPRMDDWSNFRPNPSSMIVTKTNSHNTYIDGMKPIPKNQALWEDVKFPRSSTF
ncbi:hypothetical protein K504DRAFT_450077 [Pleomassaria siparia CBS 279.74]|uniref:Zn(2)-C6 fungal-type domain-containing protein n=1 Tax=Pleomassaria siparia CBS 279.74 TaxID=1314801 RepID=A0A6G1KL72_9PLEO|nr:hypothetical protein K504DRAFT_450077 [Pleomassaria siparia CBS 279.74]